MRKNLLLTVLSVLFAFPMFAEQTNTAAKRTDIWFVGANFGLNTKTTHNESFFGNMNASSGLRFGCDVSPIVGLMAEGTFFFGDQKFGYSSAFVKAYNIDLLLSLNLTEIFWKKAPWHGRYEGHFLIGQGINHITRLLTNNNNDLIAKMGCDVGMRLGHRQQYFVYFQPALNFNLDHYSRTQININYSALQFLVGVNYRFSFSRRRHTHEASNTVEANEVIEASEQIEASEIIETSETTQKRTAMRQKSKRKAAVSENPTDSLTTSDKVQKPESAMADATGISVTAVPGTHEEKANVLPPVSFEHGVILDKRNANLASVAVYMLNHPRARLILTGSRVNANAVRDALVRNFSISASRLSVRIDEQSQQVTFNEE